jgi:hypothetical protein
MLIDPTYPVEEGMITYKYYSAGSALLTSRPSRQEPGTQA